GVALPEIDGRVAARGVAALDRDIDQFGHARAGGNIGKSTAAQDRGLEGELRRDADAHLLFARHLSRLVVENGIYGPGEPRDTIGAGAHREHALAERNIDLTLDLGRQRRDAGAPHPLPAGEPARDAPEARPPERARFGIVVERGEMLSADVNERGGRI